jgi:hypothetical protein
MPDQQNEGAPLLEQVETVTISATSERFEAKERFEKPTGIKFATVWTEFKKHFYGRVEEPIPESLLRKYRLLRIAPDAPIIAELGGPGKVEGSLAALYCLIRRQGRGEAGILQTNGYANIFYLRDVKGVLCAVRLGWDGEGWVIDAISVEDPLAWNGKHEIFCPVSGA